MIKNKTIFRFIKKIFIRLLATVVSAFSHTECISLSNQKCTTQSAIINLHPNEYTGGFSNNPFTIHLSIYQKF